MKAFSLIGLAAALCLAACGPGENKNGADSIPIDSTQPKDLQAINQQLRNDPNNLSLYHERAKFYISVKKFGEALADMQRIVNVDSSRTEYLMTMADVCFFTNRTGRSKQLLERVVMLDKKNADARIRLAQLYLYTDQFQKALNQLDSTLMIDQNKAEAYFMKGMIFKRTAKSREDTAKAVSSMQTATELDPEYYNAFVQLGIIHAEMKSSLAEEYYRNALRIQPQSEEALYNLGKYYQDAGELNKAMDTYTALLKINAHHFDAHYNMGILHTGKLKMYDEGIRYFELSMQDNPNEPRAFYGRGFCYEMKGDVNRALGDYRRALTLDPAYENAKISIDRILSAGRK